MFVNLYHLQKEIFMTIDLAVFVPAQVVVAGKAFTYKVPAGMVLDIRQPVVVDFGSKGLTVGIVESIDQVPVDPNAKFKYKWVVAVIDRSGYDAILAAEAAVAVPA
jgi:primosomal protein N'